MASSLNALPTITSTALGSNTALTGGVLKAPTAVAGFMVGMDSLNFYVQAQDQATALLNISATATGTNNSPDQTNTLHKGTMLYLNITTVAATATFGVNVQAKDPVSANYVTIGRASLDGANTVVGTYALEVYPAIAVQASLGTAGTPGAVGLALPQTYRVQVSITATASGGGASNTFTVSQSKIL